MLKIGWASRDVSTDKPVCLEGQAYERISKGILDPTTVTVLTLATETDSVIFISGDFTSFADGTVTAVGESSTYGKYCMVAHEGGFTTLYAHCSRITVSSGAAVKRGQQIAAVGETGMATGPHLHFELHRNGTYLNPVYYLATL